MGTEGDRRRKRTRRIREKEQKKIKKKWDIPLIWIIGIAFFSWFFYEIYKDEKNAILLYKYGVETTAFIYDSYTKNGDDPNFYEFYVNDKRYTGCTHSGQLGYTIPIVYLPTNPNISIYSKSLDRHLFLFFYKQF